MIIGRDLDDKLWEDLTERMHITNLRIYNDGDFKWLDGRGAGSCDIYLDNKGKVKDIFYVPHEQYIVGLDVDKDGKYPKKGLILLISKFISEYKMTGGNDSVECADYVVEKMTKVECKFDEGYVRNIVDNEFVDIGSIKWHKLWKIETGIDEGYFFIPNPPDFLVDKEENYDFMKIDKTTRRLNENINCI